MHHDSHVYPFNQSYEVAQCDDWLVDIEIDSYTNYSSPYDCDPTHARGCLWDVAAQLGVRQLWEKGINGAGVVIGIVDGGIWSEERMDADQPGLVPRVIGGWPKNWGTNAGWRRHGNMMAVGALGMAPKASLYDIRISDSLDDGARMSQAIAGIQWAIEKYRQTGTPQILCCGWGIYQQAHDPKYATDASHPLTRKIVEAMAEGMLVLFAAGNGGQYSPATWCGNDTGPGKSIWGANGHPRVMTVGAANIDEQLIGYSSQGPAALDQHKPDFCGISHYAGYFSSDSGTSSACAIASGVVALLKQACPTLTQEAAKQLLKSTAKAMFLHEGERHSDTGIIQAKAAYDQLIDGRSISEHGTEALVERLKLENRCLRELYADLAIQLQIERTSK